MPGYKPLTTDDKEYPLADPSVSKMMDAYTVEMRAGFKDRAGREIAAARMGLAPTVCDDALSYPEYVVEMCRVLFPTAADRIGDGNGVNVPEVLRAVDAFFVVLS